MQGGEDTKDLKSQDPSSSRRSLDLRSGKLIFSTPALETVSNNYFEQPIVRGPLNSKNCETLNNSPCDTDINPIIDLFDDIYIKEEEVMAFNISTALKLIPEFDGTPSHLHKFTVCCEIILNPLKDATHIKGCLEIIKSKLTGPAYDVVRYEDFDSWQSLKDELEAQFSDRRPIEHLQVELVQIRQDRTENVKTFANRVERLLSDLNDACILREGKDSAKIVRNLNSSTALKSFQDGLREPLRLIIKACRFTNLRDAVSKAIEEESSMTNNPNNVNVQSKPIIRCQLCSKLGHTSRNCYSLQINQPNLIRPQSVSYSNSISQTNPQRSFTNSNVRPINIICNYCKNVGHHLRDCRKRMYNNQKRQNNNTSPQINNSNRTIHSIPGNSKSLEPNLTDAVVRAEQI